jgi:amidophosphoribosyltransferase
VTINASFLNDGNRPEPQHCLFEYVYTASPGSIIDGQGVYDARYNSGVQLAKQFGKKGALNLDVIAPVPNSANVLAKGFSDESGIPLADVMLRLNHAPRSFVASNQQERERIVRQKFDFLEKNIDGRKLGIVDDSVVRGTTMSMIVKILREFGAKEVHVMSGSPRVMHTCYAGVDIKSAHLVGAKDLSVREVRNKICADSLTYLELPRLIKASGGGKGKLSHCTGCFNNNHCQEVQDYIDKSKR